MAVGEWVGQQVGQVLGGLFADGDRRSTMRMLWDVLARIVAASESRAASGPARTQALLRGARKYLEDGHVMYLQSTINANRAQVGLLTRVMHVPASPPIRLTGC
jgi:hypothetical protein